ncbi:hypothetical protein K3495_g13846 [Podosphaera aphanis]|nr:hypothetical protein K3495_g13846 [Podosphaera aphanis]
MTSQSADPSARKIAVPVSKRTAATEASVYPPELHAVLEAEKRRAARIKAHLSICSTAINSVEAALSPLSTGENKSFVDGIKVYLRAAIAQFVHTGPGSTPPSLPARPSDPLPSRAPQKRAPTPAAPQGTDYKKYLGYVPIPRKTKKSISKTKVDKRLFLRLPKEDEWRNASPSFLQQNISAMAAIPLANISLVQRVKTGFAITTTEETSRKKTLDLVLREGRKFEPASNLVAYLIPTVPVRSNSPTTSVPRTVEMVTQEILRVSDAVPSLVRPHGVSKIGAPHQNWIALFPRESAPRPGFKLFFESGRATIFQPRRSIEQCKRCLDYHATRGCSRALAC